MSQPSKEHRKQALHLVRAAQKTLLYRAHLIPEADQEEIVRLAEQADPVANGKETEEPGAILTKLDALLNRHGGSYQRHPGWAESVETVAVAIILAIGIRTFFLQPFSIPTNSMYPTYHGMTYELNSLKEPRSVTEDAWRFVTQLKSTYEIVAPAGGKVRIPLSPSGGDLFAFKKIGSSLPVQLPMMTGRRSYPIQCGVGPGEQMVELPLNVPEDFSSVGEIILKTWFPDAAPLLRYNQGQKLGDWFTACKQNGTIRFEDNQMWLYLNHTFQPGEKVVSFDILTGDKLFVDRFSYHFTAPTPGDSFVFRTRQVPGLSASPESYYIKRLAGGPGDSLEIRGHQLFRNGALATGGIGFDNNNAKVGEYEGYVCDFPNQVYLGNTVRPEPGTTPAPETFRSDPHLLPHGHYFAMGDNSDQSSDSRFWGDVPGNAVVGKALFIHYPFTSRWGRAK